MWPMVLDYTKDECQRMLRKLELEAYAAVVSAFRAQGELTKDKKKTLQELSNILCISLERHRAEIRRAVNDERLNTIAERIVGPNTSSDWAIEGRRLVPLMPRLVPQTAFSALANNVANSLANAQASKSAAAAPTAAPAASGVTASLEKELLHITGNGPSTAMPSCSGLNGPTTSPRPLQATAVVSPSAAWMPPTTTGTMAKAPSPAGVKTEPLPTVPDVSQADEDNATRKRKRSLSLDSLPSPLAGNATALVAVTKPASTTAPATAVTVTTPVATPAAAAPAPAPIAAPLTRVTSNGPVVTKVVVPTSLPGATAAASPGIMTKVVNLPSVSTPQLRVPMAPTQRTTSVPASSQKVILVSTTAAPSSMSSNLLQPPLSVPVVKTVSAPGTTPLVHQGKAPMVMGLQASSASHPSCSSTAAFTSVASIVSAPVPSASVSVTSEPGVVRLRPRAVTVNPRLPVRVPRIPTPVPPSMGGGPPQLPCPSPSYGKATISVPKGAIMQYRQEGSEWLTFCHPPPAGGLGADDIGWNRRKTVKIIAQSQLPISGTKLVTKAGPGSSIATSSSSSSSTSLNVAPRVSTVSITSNQTRVVNVITTSQPGVVRTLSRTVTPGTSGLSQRPSPTGLRPTLGSGAKPNVIVVHKAQVWPQAQPGMASSSSHLSRSTDSVTYLQRQDRPKTSVGACGTVTVVKTSVPVPQPCIAPVVRVSRETSVKTVPRLSMPVRKPPEQSLDGNSSSSSGGSASGSSGGSGGNNSSLLAELMQAAGILQDEGDSGRPPPLLVVGEDAVPPAEVEVAIDTVPLDDNAVILDDGHLLADSEEVNLGETTPGVVVEEAPCLLQDHVVCHEVELVAQPGLQLEVVSTSPATESNRAQTSQNGQIATKEPASHKVLPSTSSTAEQPKLKSANSGGTSPTPAPENRLDRPRSPHRKRPGSDDGKDVPGASNGVVACGVAERLGLMVSGTTAIPISSTSIVQATDTAQAQRPATNSPAIVATQPAQLVSSEPLKKASSLLRQTNNSDLAVPGPSKMSAIGSTWKPSRKSPPPGPSSTGGQQPNGPQQPIVHVQPVPPVSMSEAPSTSNGPSRVMPSVIAVESLNENSNADMSDSLSSRQASKNLRTTSSGNGGPSQSSPENIAEDSAENSVENLMQSLEGNSDDNTNDSSQESSSVVGGAINEEDSVEPTDLQDSISSSSSAALVYPRNPDEEQSAIISSSSNDHGRRDIHKAKRACDVSSSTSVSASPCPVAPMPSTSAVFDEQRLPAASSTPSAPEQNSPDQTSEGSSTGHFQLPSCFGEDNGGSSSNVTSAELEIAVVSSPTPDAQELANSASGESSVAGSEERRNSAVESSEQDGPAEVSSAVTTQQPGISLLRAQREEVTSAQNGNGSSSAASSEVTSAVSCPNFDNDDDDGVDGNEAGPLVSELVVNSDEEEVSTAEAVLVHSEGLAEITCSTIDAASASTASGSLFHLNTRPLSVSSTEEAEYLGGSVEVDSHEDIPDAQAFSDVGTSSSCGNRGEVMGTEATVGTVPPAPDEASSDSHSGVESSRTVSTACDSAPPAGNQGNLNGASDQPSQSETGSGFSTASAAEEPVESGNIGEEVYELLICDSEASEGITSVMVDSVSSTVFGAQRAAGPSPSTYHLVSLPSCSSSGPSTSHSPPTIDVASLSLAYHRTDDVAHLDTSSSSSLSSSNGQPIVADSSAGLPLRDNTAALNSVPGSTSSGSQPVQVDNGHTSNNGSGSSGSSSSGTNSDPATPLNIDDSETYENGAASTCSSACDVILVGAHAGGTSSEIVVFAEEEATANVTVSSDNCDDDSSSNAAFEDVPGNLLTVSSSASVHSHCELVNGVPDEHTSTSRLVLHQDEDSAASSAISDIDAVVGNVVTVETVRDIVEQVVTSSASVTPVSLSQPSTSRGTTGPQLLLKRKRRVNALIDESLCASGHVSGWARVASGLLDRVCKFRGANRSKGVPPPAHWFLEPVDPEDAPGYYDIIDQPMDFSTIKKKLESGQYRDITEFHEDMMLVKRNCQTYNPPDHEASLDCEEVFAFYLQEYNRLVEKWQKSHLLSSPKRSKLS
ncbi:streptococcal hemagglutinin-like isoform X1 [Dermacentor albipictus]|uniref:streptococcal hemagglutinin-like isoform X1 n=1 Tax=Dermacentor albipictus TaxID=60249 RepID=UPI0031FE13A3